MIRVARVCVFVCVGDYLSVQDCTAAQVLTSTWSHVLEEAKRRACSKRFTPFPSGTDSLATVVHYSVVRRDIFPRSFGSRGGHCQPQVNTSTLLTDPAAARWRTNSSFTKKLVWTCQTEAQRARKSTNRTDFIFFFFLTSMTFMLFHLENHHYGLWRCDSRAWKTHCCLQLVSQQAKYWQLETKRWKTHIETWENKANLTEYWLEKICHDIMNQN